MPKKIPVEEKRRWLEQYESGKLEAAIASKYGRDIRTIKNGIEEVRREQDVRLARTELLKEALRKHQESLEDELRNILKELESSPYDLAPLSWYRGNNSVFSVKEVGQESENSRFAKRGRRSVQEAATILDLLRQHFRSDKSKLWTLLAQWEKAHDAYLADRKSLQRKAVTILGIRTSYKVIDSKEQATPPFLYAHVAGHWLYKSALDHTLSLGHSYLNEDDIVADTQRGVVTYRHSILAEALGNEEQTRQNILTAYDDIRTSEELRNVFNSTRSLRKAEEKVKPVIESILLLGFIPGRCVVCQRLGL